MSKFTNFQKLYLAAMKDGADAIQIDELFYQLFVDRSQFTKNMEWLLAVSKQRHPEGQSLIEVKYMFNVTYTLADGSIKVDIDPEINIDETLAGEEIEDWIRKHGFTKMSETFPRRPVYYSHQFKDTPRA